MMEDPKHETLDELLAKLPHDVALPRNLWPGVARGIERRPRIMRSFAFAASAAMVCLVGALMWGVLRERPAERSDSATNSQTLGFDEPRDPAYLAARAELEKSFRERIAILDPQTRTKIEASLALIRRAHEEIRQALADQPANPVLERLLESTWHDEFDLYDHVVRGTQPTVTRS
jgi:hypothetical protein